MVDTVLLIGIAAAIYVRSRKTTVNPENVNSDWTGTVAPPAVEPAVAAAAA